MKRTLVLALLGITAATTAFGQGAFTFSNYVEPYVPIKDTLNNLVGAGSGVQIELWWAPGSVAQNALTFASIANWSAYAGYTSNTQIFTIPAVDYVPSSTWTLQLRASGTLGGQAVDTVLSRSALVVTSNIGNLESSPPGVPTNITAPGFVVVVPEPSTFALAGLGAAAMLIFRRRN
jgi:hypothetical protein